MKEFVLGEKSELTLVADAVRAKTGKNNTLNLSEMITEIENIELGRNEEEILKEWIEDLGSGNYSSYTNNLCSSIGKGVFAETEIRSAIFPNCKTINTKAFKNCTKLSYFQGDNVNYIYDEAFNGCNKLSEARLYNIFEIGNSAFYNCGNLTSN